MEKIENHCVSCDLYCLGKSCPYVDVTVYYCDQCGDYAKYRIDGEDYCEDCAEEYIKTAWDDLTLEEKAKALDIYMTEID